jgi:hypothetical protein
MYDDIGRPVESASYSQTVTEAGCEIKFNPHMKLPAGYPQGYTAVANLEIVAIMPWKGVIQFSSVIDGNKQSVIRRVIVS